MRHALRLTLFLALCVGWLSSTAARQAAILHIADHHAGAHHHHPVPSPERDHADLADGERHSHAPIQDLTPIALSGGQHRMVVATDTDPGSAILGATVPHGWPTSETRPRLTTLPLERHTSLRI